MDAEIRTPHDKLVEMEREFLARSAQFGWVVGALYRIAQGVADPQGAARLALRSIGWGEVPAHAPSGEAASPAAPQTGEVR